MLYKKGFKLFVVNHIGEGRIQDFHWAGSVRHRDGIFFRYGGGTIRPRRATKRLQRAEICLERATLAGGTLIDFGERTDII